MAKHVIIYNLPDDQYDLDLSLKANDMHSIIYDFHVELRGRVKHGDDVSTDWNEVHDIFWKILKDYDYDPVS